MKQYGDIKKIRGYNVPIVDVVTGGSPCQDLSVAGKRKGLAGERSGLFMEQIRIIKEMRENDRETNGHEGKRIRPRWMVWENVPGAFSSNKGEDFRAVLEETAKVADRYARIPGIEGGAKVAVFRMYHGRWVVHCLESTRCAVLGSTPEKKKNRTCGRFWRRQRTRNTI